MQLHFNYRDANGVDHVYWAVWSDVETWLEGQPDSFQEVHSSASGIVHSGSSYAWTWTDPLPAGAEVRARLFAGFVEPQEMEYHRQSDWVTRDMIDGTDVVLDPTPWRFNAQLNQYPYLELT
jgi:hypothetical protein